MLFYFVISFELLTAVGSRFSLSLDLMKTKRKLISYEMVRERPNENSLAR